MLIAIFNNLTINKGENSLNISWSSKFLTHSMIFL